MGLKHQKPGAKLAPGHAFSDLVTQAYRVFSYPTPTSTDVCRGCCMDPKIEADFFVPSIDELPLSYIRDWYFAAYDPRGVSKATWGNLLPRLLEVLACGQDVSNHGLEVSLNRFDTGNPSNWTPAEWAVLDAFQRRFLMRAIQDGAEFLDDTLCMFSLAGWPMQGLLEQVASVPSPVLAERFWKDWCQGRAPGCEGIWITAFWEGGANTEVFDFYTSKALFDRMETLAFAEDTDPELARKALAVASVIEANGAWLPD